MTAGTLTEREQVQRWPQVRLDTFQHLAEMRVAFMDALNGLCDLAMKRHGWTHRINSDYRDGDSGEHGRGNAADIVFYIEKPGDVPVGDQYDFAVSTRLFRRVGAYPHWNAPGLHVDLRAARLFWWRDKATRYHYALNPEDVRKALA